MIKRVIRHEDVGQPRAGRPWRIAHVSDLHIWFDPKPLHWVTEVLASWCPDLVAMTGDYADTPTGRSLVTRWLADLGARWPVGWIAGNHDRWFGSQWLLKMAGIRGTQWIDAGELVVRRGDGSCCRLSPWVRGGPARQRQEPRAWGERRVVLVHDPALVELPPGCGLDLILAGHLHGSQVVFGRDGRGRALPGGWFYRWCGDRWDWEDGSLIVSRGLGDTLPIRFRCPRELVLIELW